MSDVVGRLVIVPIDKIRPNPWNPNAMDNEMLDRERASIERFGFVSPVLGREIEGEDWYELIDGEHRWKIARELQMRELPLWSLGPITELAAKELTLALREIHGDHDPDRVQAILREIANSESGQGLRDILPYGDEVFAKLKEMNSTFDWKALEAQTADKVVPERAPSQNPPRRWVERLYRLSDENAEALDQAILAARENSGDPDLPDAEALGVIASDYLN
jgi:hypothetical protein